MKIDGGDTHVSISNLDDRRRIKDLEQQIADLQTRLKPLDDGALTIDRGKCRHHGQATISDAHDPNSLTCSDCGEEINPYEFIRRIAHREVNFCFTRNDLRKQAKELAIEVKRLKARRADLRRKERAT